MYVTPSNSTVLPADRALASILMSLYGKLRSVSTCLRVCALMRGEGAGGPGERAARDAAFGSVEHLHMRQAAARCLLPLLQPPPPLAFRNSCPTAPLQGGQHRAKGSRRARPSAATGDAGAGGTRPPGCMGSRGHPALPSAELLPVCPDLLGQWQVAARAAGLAARAHRSLASAWRRQHRRRRRSTTRWCAASKPPWMHPRRPPDPCWPSPAAQQARLRPNSRDAGNGQLGAGCRLRRHHAHAAAAGGGGAAARAA